MPVIVEGDFNYADEFDTYGFQLYKSKEEFEEDFESWVKYHKDDYETREDVKKFRASIKEWNEWWEKYKLDNNLAPDTDFEHWRWQHYFKTNRKEYFESKSHNEPEIEFYFGTNEAISFSLSDLKDLIHRFQITEITQDTYQELKDKRFYNRGFWLLDR